MEIDFVRSRFIKHFDGQTGNIYAAPGRINLIGEHTDYNGGFVFPGAIDKGIMCEIRPNGSNTVMAYAIDLKDRVEFKIDDPQGPRASWARYIYGIIQEMKKLGVDVKGFNIAFAGDEQECHHQLQWKVALHTHSTTCSVTIKCQNGTWFWLVRQRNTIIVE